MSKCGFEFGVVSRESEDATSHFCVFLNVLYINSLFVRIYKCICVSFKSICSTAVAQIDDITTEADKDECVPVGLASGEPEAELEQPLDAVNGKPETDDKENNNGMSTDETQAVRYESRTETLKSSVILKQPRKQAQAVVIHYTPATM